jgi:hypothetical protein
MNFNILVLFFLEKVILLETKPDLYNKLEKVLAVFTFNLQVSQYKYIALRADCNSAAVSANITVSSTYSNKYNLKYTKARLVQQARKAMFYVLRKARKLSLPIDILLQLFDVMVAPILL